MYLVSGLVPGPSLGPGLLPEKVPVFEPNRPSRCLGLFDLFIYFEGTCVGVAIRVPCVNKYIYFCTKSTISCTFFLIFITKSSGPHPKITWGDRPVPHTGKKKPHLDKHFVRVYTCAQGVQPEILSTIRIQISLLPMSLALEALSGAYQEALAFMLQSMCSPMCLKPPQQVVGVIGSQCVLVVTYPSI